MRTHWLRCVGVVVEGRHPGGASPVLARPCLHLGVRGHSAERLRWRGAVKRCALSSLRRAPSPSTRVTCHVSRARSLPFKIGSIVAMERQISSATEA